MPSRQIIIHSAAKTEPPQTHLLHQGGFDEVQWKCVDHNGKYILALPGGIFEGKTTDFKITIDSENLQPSTALKLVANPPNKLIHGYITAVKAPLHTHAEPPPEIIVEANFFTAAKKQKKKKKK